MDEQFEPLDDDEVLFVSVGRVLMSNPTFKVGEFIDALAQAINEQEATWSDDNEGWFGDGLNCEALRFGTKGWQKGRVRIRLEFCPGDTRPKAIGGRREEAPRRLEKLNPNVEDIYRPEKPEPRFDDRYTVDDDY